MKNRTQRDPLDYGLNIYGSKHPFDFGLIFKVYPWLHNLNDIKTYLQSLEKHWITLYEWKSYLINCNKQQEELYYTAGRLFIAILLGQFILTNSRNMAVARYISMANKSDRATNCKTRHDNPILNSIGWSTKSVGIRSVALLFIMQMSAHNSLNQFFLDVSTAYRVTHVGHIWYHYMNLLLKDIKHSNYLISGIYRTLDKMLVICFPNEMKL